MKAARLPRPSICKSGIMSWTLRVMVTGSLMEDAWISNPNFSSPACGRGQVLLPRL